MTTCGEPRWPPSPRPSSSWARWRPSTRPECSASPTCTSRRACWSARARKASTAGGPFGGELAVPLAIALTVRALREGSVCLRLTENLDRWLPAEPADEGPDAEAILSPAELPWPDPTELSAALSAHPLVAVGPGRAGGPSAAPGRRPALPAALLGRRAAHRPPGPGPLPGHGRRCRRAAVSALPAVHRRPTGRPAAGRRDGRDARVDHHHRRSGDREDDDGRPPARRPARARAGDDVRPGRPHREGGRAAAGGGRHSDRPARRGRPRAGPAPAGGHAAPPPGHGHRIPVPIHPPRGQSAAARRGDRRRVVDGGPAHDGSAAGVGPARTPGWSWSGTPTSWPPSTPGRSSATSSPPRRLGPHPTTSTVQRRSCQPPARPMRRAPWPSVGSSASRTSTASAGGSLSSAPRSGSVTWPPCWRCSPPRTKR